MLGNNVGIFYLKLGIFYSHVSYSKQAKFAPYKVVGKLQACTTGKCPNVHSFPTPSHMGSVVLKKVVALTNPVQPHMIDYICFVYSEQPSDCKLLSFALKRPVRQCLLITTAWFLLRVI